MHNSEFLIQKRILIEKIKMLFEKTGTEFLRETKLRELNFVQNLNTTSVKITKGENLFALPFVVSDAAYSFKDNDIFSIRTLFWWGNFISTSIICSGSFFDNIFCQHNKVLSHMQATNFEYTTSVWENRVGNTFTIPALKVTSEFIDHLLSEKKIRITIVNDINSLDGNVNWIASNCNQLLEFILSLQYSV